MIFGYSHSDIGFDRGGKGNIDTFTCPALLSWEHENGAYVDGVVKVDRFANTIHGKISNGATAFGDYNSNGAGAHVESGFRWVDGLWSVRPYLAFTGFTQMVRTTRYQTACARMWEIPGYYALKRERR